MKNLFKVAIVTKDLSDYLGFCNRAFIFGKRSKELPEEAAQKGHIGFRSLNGKNVVLYQIDDLNWERFISCDFMIADSTQGVEQLVQGIKGKGVIVGRYSQFYRRSSEYTNRTPEQGGYSLDIPKNANTSFQLLTDDGVLESLTNRNEQEIRTAIDNLNPRLEQGVPILITPYLTEALSRQ